MSPEPSQRHVQRFSLVCKRLSRLFAVLIMAALLGVTTATLTVTAVSAADIIHVKTAATGSGNGSSWANASTLQDALQNRAEPGDEIWVVTGIYTPGLQISDTFRLWPGIAVYGGFVGTETERAQRDWEANPTVLSGDIGGDDVTDERGVVTSVRDIETQNSHRVVTVEGMSVPMTTTTVIDGLFITAGKANSARATYGAGFYCNGTDGRVCNPLIENVVFSANDANFGGAMYNDGSRGNASPTLVNVLFTANWVHEDSNYPYEGHGGAMFNNGYDGISSPSLINVTFTDNHGWESGGAIYNNAENGVSSPTMNNVAFYSNTVTWGTGGGIHNYVKDGISNPVLNNVRFAENSAEGGGAMSSENHGGICNPTLVNVSIFGNKARGGAAINQHCNDGECNTSITNATITGNLAYVRPPGSGTCGGIRFECTNSVCNPVLTNTILWGNDSVNEGQELYLVNTNLTVRSSLIQGGINGAEVFIENSAVVDGGGNLAGRPWDDPLFVKPAKVTDAPTSVGDLHLRTGSPAIDAGGNEAITITTDLDGNPRKQDGNGDGIVTADLGAYEAATQSAIHVTYSGKGSGQVVVEPSGVSCSTPCLGIYSPGTVVTLTATVSDIGTVFGGWSGDYGSSDNPIVMKLDSGKYMTATFSASGSIRGAVVDESDLPMKGVSVTLSSEVGSALAIGDTTQITDASGAYEFDDLLPGNYTLTFAVSGYKTPDLVDVSLAEGQSYKVDDVDLQPLVVIDNVYLPATQVGKQ